MGTKTCRLIFLFTVSERFVDDVNAEMPDINCRYLGIKNRSSYNTFAPEVPLFLMSGIQKFDYQDLKEVDRYELPDGKYMGQPVVAPRVGSESEDDGYLIAYVGNLEQTRSVDLERPKNRRRSHRAWAASAGCARRITRLLGQWQRHSDRPGATSAGCLISLRFN